METLFFDHRKSLVKNLRSIEKDRERSSNHRERWKNLSWLEMGQVSYEYTMTDWGNKQQNQLWLVGYHPVGVPGFWPIIWGNNHTWGYTSELDGLFHGKSIYKWMRTGGTHHFRKPPANDQHFGGSLEPINRELYIKIRTMWGPPVLSWFISPSN